MPDVASGIQSSCFSVVCRKFNDLDPFGSCNLIWAHDKQDLLMWRHNSGSGCSRWYALQRMSWWSPQGLNRPIVSDPPKSWWIQSYGWSFCSARPILRYLFKMLLPSGVGVVLGMGAVEMTNIWYNRRVLDPPRSYPLVTLNLVKCLPNGYSGVLTPHEPKENHSPR